MPEPMNRLPGMDLVQSGGLAFIRSTDTSLTITGDKAEHTDTRAAGD